MSVATYRDELGERSYLLLPRAFSSRNYATGSTAVVEVGGEVDFEAVRRFTVALEAAASTKPALVVLDSSALTFIDASGLGAIVSARELLRARSGDMVIRNAPFMLRRLLGIVGLTSLLEEG